MSNARQQCARSRLKDNSQMLKIKNQMYKYNDWMIKDFLCGLVQYSGSSQGWPRFRKLLYFLSGGSKWCRECSDEQSLRKRSRPEVSIKSDTVTRQINLVIKCMPVHIAMAASSYPNTGHGGHRFLHARPSGLQIVGWDRPGSLAVRCMVESLLTDQRQ